MTIYLFLAIIYYNILNNNLQNQIFLKKKLTNDFINDYFKKNNKKFFKIDNYQKLPFEKYSFFKNFVIIDLNNIDFLQIWGNIKIDNLNNNFKVIFDTGSPYFWIPSKNCENCWNKFKKFNCFLNINCKNLDQQKELFYGFGYIKGDLVIDNIYFKDINNLIEIKNYKFILANRMKNLNNLFSDGVFGLGHEIKLNKENFIEILYKNKKINNPYITFLFSKYDNYYGQMIIGELNKLAINNQEIEWKNADNDTFWTITIENIYLNKKLIKFNNKEIPFLIDSGNSFLYFPVEIYNQIYNILSNKFDCKEKNEILICFDLLINKKIDNIYPNLSFYLVKKEFILNPFDYIFDCKIVKEKKLRKCIIKISKNEYSFGIIGLTFFKKFYIIFDYKNKKIGFVKNNLYEYNNNNLLKLKKKSFLLKFNINKNFNIYYLIILIALIILLLCLKKYFFKNQRKFLLIN